MTNNNQASAALFLAARTGVHCGSGSSMEVIDLPIQRERTTGFPVIQGSSLKGAMRDAWRQKVGDENQDAIFGPPVEENRASDHASAVAFTDARLLFFPIRSFKGVFALVTCPLALDRARRDLDHAGVAVPGGLAPEKGEILVGSDSALVLESNKAVLEEYSFTAKKIDLAALAALLPESAKAHAKRLAVLSDDDFTSFVKTSTEVNARIAIDKDKGTVRRGALWNEEYLPAESILYASVFTVDARDGSGLKAFAIRDQLSGALATVTQIGGNETIGKGLAELEWRSKSGAGA